MTMEIINMFIKIDKCVASVWSPEYSECKQLSVLYKKNHVYFVYCIYVEVH